MFIGGNNFSQLARVIKPPPFPQFIKELRSVGAGIVSPLESLVLTLTVIISDLRVTGRYPSGTGQTLERADSEESRVWSETKDPSFFCCGGLSTFFLERLRPRSSPATPQRLNPRRIQMGFLRKLSGRLVKGERRV